MYRRNIYWNPDSKVAKPIKERYGFVLLGECVLGFMTVSLALVQEVPVVVRALAGMVTADSVAKGGGRRTGNILWSSRRCRNSFGKLYP